MMPPWPRHCLWLASLASTTAWAINNQSAVQTTIDNTPRALPPSDSSSDSISLATDLSAYCEAVFSQFTHTYISTALATSLNPWYEGFGATDGNGNLIGPVTSQSYWTDTIIYTQYAVRAYTAEPPCCGSCYMTAGTIEFFFWPDQASATSAPTESPSTLVDASGFTFTSPSVYLAFSSLVASNKCGQVGPLWTSTTLPFPASAITTANPITTLTVLSSPTVEAGTTYNYIISALTTQPPPSALNYADVGQNCSTLAGYEYWPDNPINAANANWVHDPCHPVILLPEELLDMQEEWVRAGCGMPPGTSGAYDPPHVLTQAGVIGTASLPGATTAAAAAAIGTTAVARETGGVTSGSLALPVALPSTTKEGPGGVETVIAPLRGVVDSAMASAVSSVTSASGVGLSVLQTSTVRTAIASASVLVLSGALTAVSDTGAVPVASFSSRISGSTTETVSERPDASRTSNLGSMRSEPTTAAGSDAQSGAESQSPTSLFLGSTSSESQSQKDTGAVTAVPSSVSRTTTSIGATLPFISGQTSTAVALPTSAATSEAGTVVRVSGLATSGLTVVIVLLLLVTLIY